MLFLYSMFAHPEWYQVDTVGSVLAGKIGIFEVYPYLRVVCAGVHPAAWLLGAVCCALIYALFR